MSMPGGHEFSSVRLQVRAPFSMGTMSTSSRGLGAGVALTADASAAPPSDASAAPPSAAALNLPVASQQLWRAWPLPLAISWDVWT